MRGVQKLGLALAIVALLAPGLAACGGNDSDRSNSDSSKGSDDAAAAGDSAANEGSASFRTPGGDNSIQNFGEEADASQVDAASAALANYLEARSEDDWASQCAYLAQGAVAPLEELASRSPRFKGEGCAAVLSGLMAGTPASSRANTLTTGAIASLRFEGDRAFALYHGARGIDYFVPMVKEDGEWKVGALAPSEFP